MYLKDKRVRIMGFAFIFYILQEKWQLGMIDKYKYYKI